MMDNLIVFFYQRIISTLATIIALTKHHITQKLVVLMEETVIEVESMVFPTVLSMTQLGLTMDIVMTFHPITRQSVASMEEIAFRH